MDYRGCCRKVHSNTEFTRAALASAKSLLLRRLMKFYSLRISQILAVSTALICASIWIVAASHAHEFRVGKLSIDHPWARPTAPSARTGVVYFSVKNSAAQGDTLLGVVVGKKIAKRASLHEMSMNAKGLMHMAEIKSGLALAGKTELKFAPGGYHVMLEGLSKPLVAKQEFGMTLQFAKAGSVSVIVLVE